MFEPDPDIIWVGTGEAANRNSSGWGNGIFKTTDGGRTWQHLGLADTRPVLLCSLVDRPVSAARALLEAIARSRRSAGPPALVILTR